MERAAIVGVYDYIGFSLCRHLLEAGVEIEGIHSTGKINDYFTEEKRLEIGRNANFSEIDIKNWEADGKDDFLFVALFEALQNRKETVDFPGTVIGELENNHSKKTRTVVILPAYLAFEDAKLKDTVDELNRFIDCKDSAFLTIFLPTIYGPWQPEEFFFQQAMNCLSFDGREIPDVCQWEWTYDALYIDDAIEAIKEMAESGVQGQYLLSSGEENRWMECAGELLGKERPELRDTIDPMATRRSSVKVKTIGKNEEIGRGLAKQKEQYARIQESRV